MKRWLVTGGLGFIGSNFIKHMLEVDPEVYIVNFDAETYAGNMDNMNDIPDIYRYKLVLGNIINAIQVADVIRENKITTIVHFAAETHVDRSIHDSEVFMRTNIMGTYTLLEQARLYWGENNFYGCRFHHVSTDEVYGSLSPSEAPWNEDSPYKPNSPYAASKAASDHLVRSYGHTYKLPFTISNCSNNYGPNQHPEKLIPFMIMNALAGKMLPLYGDGEQIRDWLYVKDHCEAIRLILAKGKTGETYNVGGSQMMNVKLVGMLCGVLDELVVNPVHHPHENAIYFVEDRAGHDRRYAINSDKIRQLGWEPKETLRVGLVETVKWYLDNPKWLANIRNKPTYEQWVKLNYANRRTECVES